MKTEKKEIWFAFFCFIFILSKTNDVKKYSDNDNLFYLYIAFVSCTNLQMRWNTHFFSCFDFSEVDFDILTIDQNTVHQNKYTRF